MWALRCNLVVCDSVNYLDITEVMSSMAAESRVDQHRVQPINQGLPLGLRHKGPHVQVLWILYILLTKKDSFHN